MNFCQFFLAIAVVVASVSLSHNLPSFGSRHLKKRSIISLGQMITSLTGRSPVQFINYGLWCGLGGDGTPIDSIDECCFTHDKCYDAALEGPCNKLKEHPVFLKYSWSQNETEGLSCQASSDACKTTVCKCDIQIATCFMTHNETYNEKNRVKKLLPLNKLKNLLNETRV